MKTRRGFFQLLAKAAAIIALAPQIAFGVKPVKLNAEEIIHELCQNDLLRESRNAAFCLRFQMSQPYNEEDIRRTPITMRANQDGPRYVLE